MLFSKLKIIAELSIATFREWWNDNIFLWAAAIAFYTIFSLAPVLMISVGIASLVFSEAQAKAQITKEIENLTGAEGGVAVRQVLSNLGQGNRSPRAIIIGLLAVVIGSTAVFANLQAALNAIWHVQPKTDRSMWKVLLRVRMRSFGIVLAVGFLLLVSMVISALLNGLQAYAAEQMAQISWVWWVANIGISYGIVTLLFATIYKYLPDVQISWSDVMIGAAITSALFSIGKYLIGLYLGQVAISSTYGAAGSFVVLLIWIYYSSVICFFGAEFTQIYAARFGRRIKPEAHAATVPENK